MRGFAGVTDNDWLTLPRERLIKSLVRFEIDSISNMERTRILWEITLPEEEIVP